MRTRAELEEYLIAQAYSLDDGVYTSPGGSLRCVLGDNVYSWEERCTHADGVFWRVYFKSGYGPCSI